MLLNNLKNQMIFSQNEESQAISWIKNNKKQLFNEYLSLDQYPSYEKPLILMMAGSPGAGKTEISKELIKQWLNLNPPIYAIRLDADEIREKIPGYNGTNSDCYQKASGLGITYLVDEAFERKQNILIDGTLAHLDRAIYNINRALSLKRNYKVNIIYIYQNPLQSWKYTKIREKVEGRTVPVDIFLKAFLEVPKNLKALKEKYGKELTIDIIHKNDDNDLQLSTPNNVSIIDIDKYINMVYNISLLEEKLSEIENEIEKNTN